MYLSLNSLKYRAFWEKTDQPSLKKFLDFRFSAGDIEKMLGKTITFVGEFAPRTALRLIDSLSTPFYPATCHACSGKDCHAKKKLQDEEANLKIQELQTTQHITIASVTTEQIQKYAESITISIAKRFLNTDNENIAKRIRIHKNDNDENCESDSDESDSNENESDKSESIINVSRKFKEYQMQLIESVIENVVEGVKISSTKYSLASIIVLIKPCPYSTFTPDEWKQVINTNPYAVKESVWDNPFASLLSEACSNIAIGLDNNFVSNDESDLGKKASRIFNNLKEDLTSAQTKKITENEHRFYYLDPLLRPFFCGDSKDYKVRLDKSVKGSLKRPDFSCRIDDITILNSKVKPLGDDINSYFMDLQYDGIYRSWPLLATKLITEKELFPLMFCLVFQLYFRGSQANILVDRVITPSRVHY
ncbi:8244_t:CDS:10 [Diversispora eburnea]|uniref:8244_t:CDS:1 n=1 Tax=Diversispora eburnea TaxID=1213867 RepID=A0A9N8WE39_9GLOM|nr:8244_t:CDS:10 [Diversispora eburnea]